MSGDAQNRDELTVRAHGCLHCHLIWHPSQLLCSYTAPLFQIPSLSPVFPLCTPNAYLCFKKWIISYHPCKDLLHCSYYWSWVLGSRNDRNETRPTDLQGKLLLEHLLKPDMTCSSNQEQVKLMATQTKEK
jgi:hypothetical protein